MIESSTTAALFFAGAFAAGLLGSLIGLGGGFILVPLFTLFFKLPFIEAVGTSLVCIVAASQAFALSKKTSANTDVRLGIFLEIFTVSGVMAGGMIATSINEKILRFIFACTLSLIFVLMIRRVLRKTPEINNNDKDKASGFSKGQTFLGSLGSLAGGLMSGMLGVGGGVIKVFMLRQIMGVPFKRAAATSNFMIGITVSAGAAFYLFRGHLNIMVAIPCIIGAGAGSFIAGNIAGKIRSRFLEGLFVAVLAYFALSMFMSVFS